MATTSKQSGAWATAWKSDPFHQARVKLTLWYMAIIVLIVTVFSISFYIVATQQIQHSYHQYVQDQPGQEENFLEDAGESLAWQLIVIDGIVLIVATFASFGFAGYTLKPIKLILEAQKRFIADASHELRTPLAVMRTDIEVFLRQKTISSIALQNTMQSLLEEIENLTRLSNQLLDMSKVEGKTFTSNFSPVNLEVLVNKIVNRFQNLAHTSQVVLVTRELHSVHILGNQHFLEQAFANIIENAIKYNKINGKVEISIAVINNRAEIKIIDTGIGIAEKNMPFIFERFYQSDQSKHSQGTGLGLSIVKAIVQAHGGFITAQSRLGQGTVISISLPIIKDS